MAAAKSVVLLMLALCVSCCVLARGEEKDSAKESFYEQLCRAVIRLEHIEVIFHSDRIPKVHTPTGTAFFVRRGNELYVVSARHVAQKGHDWDSRVQLRNARTGDTVVARLELPSSAWTYHPDSGDANTHYVDVAAMKIRVRNPYLPKCFLYEPTDPNANEKNQLPPTDVEPPEPVLIFGFPVDLGFQLAEQRPLARFGIMSMSAGKEFLTVSINGVRKSVEERCCLIDARMFPGNSGSPVMNQLRLGDSKPRLLGLVTATNRGLDFGVIEPVSRIRETLDLTKAKTAAGSWSWIPQEVSTVDEPNEPD